MNKFLKYFLILLALVLIVVPIVFATLLFKTSQDAFESSQDSKNANRQIYETIKSILKNNLSLFSS